MENKMTKIRASKCELKQITNLDTIDFLNENHYQGFINANVCLGLYYDNDLIEVMTFGKPRFSKKHHQWELLRLCTKKDYVVYGGASRLFKYFVNNFGGSIVSYCNASLFSGEVYKILGFVLLGSCHSYHYEKDGKKYHRSNFQKWRCLEKWPEYVGKDITEKEIMAEKGYNRVEEIQQTWSYKGNVYWYIYEIEINGYHYIGQHLYQEGQKDNYFGSGKILRNMQAKYGLGNKTILKDGIMTKEEADNLEIQYIKKSKEEYGDLNINILDGGHQAYTANTHIGFVPWNKGKKGLQIAWNKGKKGYSVKPCTEERKAKISKANKGRKVLDTSKMKNNKNALGKGYSYWKCLETGEIKRTSDWLSLGYKVHRKVYKGLHFERINNDTRN